MRVMDQAVVECVDLDVNAGHGHVVTAVCTRDASNMTTAVPDMISGAGSAGVCLTSDAVDLLALTEPLSNSIVMNVRTPDV